MDFSLLPEVGHIGYMVANADSFKDIFGEENVRVYDFVPTRAWAYGKEINDCRFRIALYSPKNGAKLEFVQFISGTNCPHEPFFKKFGDSIHHIAYYVENYDFIRGYFSKLDGAEIIFEAEIEDAVMGKRSSYYVTVPGMPGIIEISKRPTRL